MMLRLVAEAMLIAMAVAALFYVTGLPLIRESVSGIVWGNVSVEIRSFNVTSSAGVEGLDITYISCGSSGCGSVQTRLLEPRPGASAALGWGIIENIGLRLSDGSYLPASSIESRGFTWNVSWSYYQLAVGSAILDIEVSDVRVFASSCRSLRLFSVVSKSAGGCVLAPVNRYEFLVVTVNPIYGDNGFVVAEAVLPPVIRVPASLLPMVAFLGRHLPRRRRRV